MGESVSLPPGCKRKGGKIICKVNPDSQSQNNSTESSNSNINIKTKEIKSASKIKGC